MYYNEKMEISKCKKVLTTLEQNYPDIDKLKTTHLWKYILLIAGLENLIDDPKKFNKMIESKLYLHNELQNNMFGEGKILIFYPSLGCFIIYETYGFYMKSTKLLRSEEIVCNDEPKNIRLIGSFIDTDRKANNLACKFKKFLTNCYKNQGDEEIPDDRFNYKLIFDETKKIYYVHFPYCGVKNNDDYIDLLNQFLDKNTQFDNFFSREEKMKNNQQYEMRLAPLSNDSTMFLKNSQGIEKYKHLKPKTKCGKEICEQLSNGEYLLDSRKPDKIKNVIILDNCTLNNCNIKLSTPNHKVISHKENISCFVKNTLSVKPVWYKPGNKISLHTLITEYHKIYPTVPSFTLTRYAREYGLIGKTEHIDGNRKNSIEFLLL